MTVEGDSAVENILYQAMDAPKGNLGRRNPVFIILLQHPFLFSEHFVNNRRRTPWKSDLPLPRFSSALSRSISCDSSRHQSSVRTTPSRIRSESSRTQYRSASQWVTHSAAPTSLGEVARVLPLSSSYAIEPSPGLCLGRSRPRTPSLAKDHSRSTVLLETSMDGKPPCSTSLIAVAVILIWNNSARRRTVSNVTGRLRLRGLNMSTGKSRSLAK